MSPKGNEPKSVCLFVTEATQFCVTADSTLIYISAIKGVRPIPYMLYRRGPDTMSKGPGQTPNAAQ
jgi:hypothetical protein